MLLAIDAGNTNIVFAVYDGDKMRAQWRAVTQVSRTADEYGVWLGQLLELEGLSLVRRGVGEDIQHAVDGVWANQNPPPAKP